MRSIQPSRDPDFIQAAIFLNLWKAVTPIVGDPSRVRRDRYQRRYKALGFDRKYFDDKIEDMKKSRHNSDVAHDELSRDAIDDLPAEEGTAISVTETCLQAARALTEPGSPVLALF
jgi:hypothetical protein